MAKHAQPEPRRISLANKCLLLFGCAIVLILIVALSVPWFRTYVLVREYQLEVASQVANAWLEARLPGQDVQSTPKRPASGSSGLRVTFDWIEDIDTTRNQSFIARALTAFRNDPTIQHFAIPVQDGDTEVYLYARPIKASMLRSLRISSVTDFTAGAVEPSVADELKAILVVRRTTQFGESQLQLSRTYIIITGLVAGLLAVIVFYFILTKLIFSPVRRLRDTAERVKIGDIHARSNLRTGDEFEELAENFNAMLDQLEETQSRLRRMNESLDLKVAELAEANVGLWESTKFKTEFLANVSHELRTPLNSIIGFAELLSGGMDGDDSKQSRYVSNILTSGRSLLELINDLLDMAKIEAGRMDVNVEPTNIRNLIDGLVNIMTPQASNKSIRLQTEFDPKLSEIHTDPGKLQQILYNFLSNAIKFTPQDGTILLRGDCIAGDTPKLRLSVIDSGPGISADMQDVIFEKFRQADASHTREFTGTGLGLAICRELADLLNAEVSLESSLGNGSTFSVTIPTDYMPREAPSLMGQPPVS
ncbi:MAG: ATP-binding protein [Phycisphaerales bacterium]|nr:ATP-binding protein [Phycisphaerales bacterium]